LIFGDAKPYCANWAQLGDGEWDKTQNAKQPDSEIISREAAQEQHVMRILSDG
jgi:hypothetical protein